MLTSTALFETPALRISDVRCAHAPGPWAGVETAPGPALIFARRGSFRRRSAHGEEVVEPGVAILQRGGEEEEYAHPHAGGDDCTAVRLSDELLAALLVEPALPAGAIPTTAREDLAHRRVIAGARRGEDVEEAAVALVSSVLGRGAPARTAAGRPSTAAARRSLAADAREALACDPGLGVVELGRLVGASPHHLSRVFRAEVGVTVSLYRRRLRLRRALEALDGDLARVAADAGFADHAHLAREARALLGVTPSELRREVAGAVQQAGQRSLQDL